MIPSLKEGVNVGRLLLLFLCGIKMFSHFSRDYSFLFKEAAPFSFLPTFFFFSYLIIRKNKNGHNHCMCFDLKQLTKPNLWFRLCGVGYFSDWCIRMGVTAQCILPPPLSFSIVFIWYTPHYEPPNTNSFINVRLYFYILISKLYLINFL